MKINRSQIIALAAIILVAVWFGINSFGDSNTQAPAPDSSVDSESVPVPEVVVLSRASQDHVRRLSIYGRTEAIREVDVKAETAGLVVSTPLKEGQKVGRGQILCRQDIDARQANVDQAKALLRTRELEFTATKTLVDKGYRSETQVLTAQAALDGARAAVKQAEIELDNVNMRAPFSGVFERQIAHTGDYLGPGQPCALLVDLDPLIVVVELTEGQVGGVEIGQTAEINLVTGEKLEGTVRLVESRANPSTRTFRAELEIPNKNFEYKAGVTATVGLAAGSVKAHQIPGHILTLSDSGEVGVRYIDAQNIVRFAKTETVDEDPNGLWVTGLPEQTRIIVKGQDYVAVGTEVAPVNGGNLAMTQ